MIMTTKLVATWDTLNAMPWPLFPVALSSGSLVLYLRAAGLRDRSLLDPGEARVWLDNTQTNITLVSTATFLLIPNGMQINW